MHTFNTQLALGAHIPTEIFLVIDGLFTRTRDDALLIPLAEALIERSVVQHATALQELGADSLLSTPRVQTMLRIRDIAEAKFGCHAGQVKELVSELLKLVDPSLPSLSELPHPSERPDYPRADLVNWTVGFDNVSDLCIYGPLSQRDFEEEGEWPAVCESDDVAHLVWNQVAPTYIRPSVKPVADLLWQHRKALIGWAFTHFEDEAEDGGDE